MAFFQRHRDRVLRLAGVRKAREAVPTKRRPHRLKKSFGCLCRSSFPRRKVDARRITIDDIETFSAVREQTGAFEFQRMPESTFKRGVARILGEKGDLKDWVVSFAT